MKSELRQIIHAIHQSPYNVVLVMAGAGTSALSNLLKIAGASATLIEAIVPYHENAFADFYGSYPEKYVSKQTASKLAGRAFTRAQKLGGNPQTTIGLACTATITTNRPKRGKHKAYFSYWTADKVVHYELLLQKGFRSRIAEESLIGTLLINMLAEAMALPEKLPIELVEQEKFNRSEFSLAVLAQELSENKIDNFGVTTHGRVLSKVPKAILSGSFNPLHTGHTGLAQAAAAALGVPVVFECAASNVDKPPLATPTLLARLAQFAGHWPVIASNAPTYLQKSRLFPGATFIVGFDTAVRILAPRYYHNSSIQRNDALAEIAANGCHFLVAGRTDGEGIFRHLPDLAIPATFQALFQPLPAAHFRLDISSTDIREKAQNSHQKKTIET